MWVIVVKLIMGGLLAGAGQPHRWAVHVLATGLDAAEVVARTEDECPFLAPDCGPPLVGVQVVPPRCERLRGLHLDAS